MAKQRCPLSSQASCVIVSRFRAELDLDTYPLINLICPRCAELSKPGRGNPVLIMHIGFFACFHAIRIDMVSLERSRFSKIATIFLALVALKLLVSLISRLVACSARIVVDRHTNTQTHRTTTVTLTAHARRGLITQKWINFVPLNDIIVKSTATVYICTMTCLPHYA